MHTHFTFLLLLLATATTFAEGKKAKQKEAPLLPVTNESIINFKHINDVFTALGLQNCKKENQTEDLWKKMLEYEAIRPCEKHTISTLPSDLVIRTLNTPATDSGILNDQHQKGDRILRQDAYADCDKKTHYLRYTYDRVETPTGPICGFEMFIKKPSGKIVGVAIDKDGNILPVVPESLAFDKHGNKTGNKSKLISSGKGCFECHPGVSSSYDMYQHSQFWGKEKLTPHNPKNPSAHK